MREYVLDENPTTEEQITVTIKKKISAPNIKYRQKAGKLFVLRTTNVLVVDDVVDIFLFLYFSCVSGWKERDVT